MTGPTPAPQIIQEPGFGERLGDALAPLQAMLQLRQKREMQQQEMLVQRGYLSLQQEQFAAGQKQRNEQKKAMEEAALKLSEGIQKLSSPEATEQDVGAIAMQMVEAGQASNLGDAFKAIAALQERGKEAQRIQRVQFFQAQLAQAQSPQQRQMILAQAALEFPERAGALGQFAMADRGGQSQGTLRVVQGPGGKRMYELFNSSTGEWTPTGKAAPMPAALGNVTESQGKLADFATRTLEAHATLTRLEAQYPGISQRVDTKIRPIVAGEKFGAVGRTAAALIQPAITGVLSEEEQAYWNAAQELGNSRLRKATGATINDVEYEREVRPYILGSNEKEELLTAKQRRRLQAGLIDAKNSGPGFRPELLTAEAAQYWLQAQPDAAEKAKKREAEMATPYDGFVW